MKTFLGNDAPLPGNENDPNVIDMVVHLGRTRRFGGWGTAEWTVLHHTMLCSLLWLKAFGAKDVHHVLLHDAHEYITGDIPAPVKEHLPGASELESFLDRRIAQFLGVSEPGLSEYDNVKLVDTAALIIEAFYFGTRGSFHIIGSGYWAKLPPSVKASVHGIVEAAVPEVARAMGWAVPDDGPVAQWKRVYP